MVKLNSPGTLLRKLQGLTGSGIRARALWLGGIAAAALVAPALGMGFSPAHACDGAYCTDAVQPANVAATATDSSTIRINWSEPQHTVYDTVDARMRQDSLGGPETDLPMPRHFDNTRQTWYVTAGALHFNTTYCFSLRTRGDNNTVSDWSDWACATTPYPPLWLPGTPRTTASDPAAARPTGLQPLAADSHSITLGWTYTGGSSEFVGFRVYRDGQVVGTVDPSVDGTYQYADGGLQSLHTYTYTVCVLNRDGDLLLEGICSDPFAARTLFAVSTTAVNARARGVLP